MLFYKNKAWFIGKNKMKDWKACIRTWENKRKKETNYVEASELKKDKYGGFQL